MAYSRSARPPINRERTTCRRHYLCDPQLIVESMEGDRSCHVSAGLSNIVSATAVHVQVDEAGQQPGPSQIDRITRHRGAGADGAYPTPLDAHPALIDDGGRSDDTRGC